MNVSPGEPSLNVWNGDGSPTILGPTSDTSWLLSLVECEISSLYQNGHSLEARAHKATYEIFQ